MNIGLAITIGSFLITCGTLIWKIAIVGHQVEINKQNINGLGIKLDDHRNKLDVKIEEFSNQMHTMAVTLGKIEYMLLEKKKGE